MYYIKEIYYNYMYMYYVRNYIIYYVYVRNYMKSKSKYIFKSFVIFCNPFNNKTLQFLIIPFLK